MAYVNGDHRIDISARLSLWEIAHRWENENPLSDTVASVAVLDRLRWLVDALAADQADQAHKSVLNSETANLLHRKLLKLGDLLCEGVIDALPFKQYTASCIDIDYACWQFDKPLPDFWFEVAQTNSDNPQKTRQNASARTEVIELASVLWKKHPEIERRDEILNLPDMQALLASVRAGETTVLDWISRANPRPPDQRPKGRRKKT